MPRPRVLLPDLGRRQLKVHLTLEERPAGASAYASFDEVAEVRMTIPEEFYTSTTVGETIAEAAAKLIAESFGQREAIAEGRVDAALESLDDYRRNNPGLVGPAIGAIERAARILRGDPEPAPTSDDPAEASEEALPV